MISVSRSILAVVVGIFLFTMEVAAQNLRVSDNGRFLVKSDGTPFIWIGDTAWELFHRLDSAEANKYLSDRADKGFNVIQAVVLAELDGLNTPNANGDIPLIENDPTKPNGAYFEHVDYMLGIADRLDLYMAILPSWGEWVTPRFGDYIFKNTSDAYTFGNYLGQRFRGFQNIIWVLGGDRLPDERKEGIAIWRAMAEGVTDGVNGTDRFDKEADYSTTLMTYHCFAPSSDFFREDAWIDFHSWGSYHNANEEKRAYTIAQEMWKDLNTPIINLEPAYEKIPKNYEPNAKAGYFDASDVRRHAYWSVFTGAFGHTYGAHPIWQMYNKDVGPRSTYTPMYWSEALNLEGANDMKHIKHLLLSRPNENRTPALNIIKEQTEGTHHISAFKGETYAMIYIPEGNDFQVKMGFIEGAKVKAWWFNPRDGTSLYINEYINEGEISFYPLGEPNKGNDWVLVLDNSDKEYTLPGI